MITIEHLTWSAIGIGILTLAVGAATMALSFRYHYRHTRREAIRERIRTELFERLFSTDPPAWDEWIETLSRTEREQLRYLLEEYARKLRGTEHTRLRKLGSTLGIQTCTGENLDAGRNRLESLTWLALLEEPLEPERLEACCSETPQLRAAAARVLHKGNVPDTTRAGTKLLVDGEFMTAFGMDTLYQLNNGTDTPVLSMLEEDSDTWSERLLVQVLIVLRYCNITDSDNRLEPLFELVEHESPRVRTAAVGILERHGWRETYRTRIDVEALLADPDPAVRHDAYLMFASWSTEQSAGWLRRALTSTGNGRDTLELVRAYSAHAGTDLSELPAQFDPFVEWVRADEAAGRRQRVWGVSAAWA